MGREVRTATFNGVVYDIQSTGAVYGSCDPPPGTPGKPCIFNAALPGTCKELEIWIHESLHASHWRLPEFIVERVAREIARLLWRLGYRKP